MVQHLIQAQIGLETLQIIYAITQCINAELTSLILLIFCMAMCIFQIVLMTKYHNLNIYTQLAINVMSIVAHQNQQFLVLQSLVGFVLLLQTEQKNWIINVFICLIQITIICVYSQNSEVQSYFMSAFSISIITYFFWAIKLPKLKKQSSAVELLPLHLQPSARSLEDVPTSQLSAIVLETQTLDILIITQDLRNKVLGIDISEYNLLDKIIIQKVDKGTQKSVIEKIKGLTLRQLLQKFVILQRKDSLMIIKTNLHQLEYFVIKILFEKDKVTLQFLEVKEFAKYVKKHSCFALMNKLFQSFSHEFGTLLNQIALVAQVGFTQFPQQQQQYELIYNCCIIMNNMVKDLKDFHQLRSKTFQLEIGEVNVDLIFNELQSVFKLQALQKQLTIFCVNKTKIFFKQDQQRIKQILQNLLQNAIKYTEQGGIIYVTAEKYDDKRIKFSVMDSGIGINEQVAQNIRQMMSNDLVLTSKISSGAAGLGLGLLNSNYLVKQLSSFQQGNKQHLQFSSKEGEGSNFWFLVSKYSLLESPQSQIENKSIKMIDKKTFFHQKTNNLPPPPSLNSNSKSCPSQFKRMSPKKNSYVAPPQYFFPSSEVNNGGDDQIIYEESHSVDEDPIPNHLPGPRARIPSLSTPECQCFKLLIVDDEPANLFPLQMMIKILGYNCDTAQSGQQAINKIHEREKSHCQFRLILMDINMPQLSGIETTRRLKIQYPEIVIVACSAFSDMQTKYEAQSAGMENYIEKPINKENLQEILEIYL